MSAILVKESKVGRNRIYSNEQRKDRNRKAQAAFRVRRSQYTKELEQAILQIEKTVTQLKDSNTQLEERAKTAEERCTQLSLEIESLHKLFQLSFQQKTNIISSLKKDEWNPVSPSHSCSTVMDMNSYTSSDKNVLNLDDILTTPSLDYTIQPEANILVDNWFLDMANGSELFDTCKAYL